MTSQWEVKPLGPGLWWFKPEHDEARAAADEAPGWGDDPLYLAWVDNSTGGLTYEHVGAGKKRHPLKEGLGKWLKADIPVPKLPKT